MRDRVTSFVPTREFEFVRLIDFVFVGLGDRDGVIFVTDRDCVNS